MRGRAILALSISSIAVAGVTGFFLGANYTRSHQKNAIVPSIVTQTSTDTTPVTSVDTTNQDSTSTQPTESADTSGQTYIVKKGDTLFSIGKTYNMSWTVLAAANDLTETSALKEGQVLKIPSATEANTIQSKEFKITPDNEENQTLQAAQQYANAGTGQLAYRLVPTQVVQQSAVLASKFSFSNNDLYIEKSKDTTKGEAVVEVTHAGHLYTVYLSQPLDKGDKGVWTPMRVTY